MHEVYGGYGDKKAYGSRSWGKPAESAGPCRHHRGLRRVKGSTRGGTDDHRDMTTWHEYMENKTTAKVTKALIAANRAVTDSALPSEINELVKIRSSQINGCAFCVDMHTKDATAAGEAPQRLHLVAAWREATVYTDAERAALELAEQGTRIADGTGISDDAWADALLHFSEDEIAALVSQIVLINAFNRLNVIFGRPGGDYVVGQFG